MGLREVTSTDGITADFHPIDMKIVGETRDPRRGRVNGVPES